jgi:hypothetical protein
VVTIERQGLSTLTWTIPAGTRRVVPLSVSPLDSEARLFRLKLQSDGEYSLYDPLTLDVRPIGLYIEAGATYQVQPQPEEPTGVSIYQQVELWYEAAQPVTLRWRTDLPQNVLRVGTTPWQEITFPGGTGRQKIPMSLLPTIRGRQMAPELTSAGAVRVYGLRWREKPLGLAGETKWDWRTAPIPTTPDLPSQFRFNVIDDAKGGWRWIDVGLPETSNAYQWVRVATDGM